MSKELEFIILMSIWKMNPEQDQRVLCLAREGLKWDAVYAEVARNRMWSVVYYNMKRLQLMELPFAQDIAEATNKCTIKNMKLTMTLAKVFKLFEDHKIEALVLKGPALSQLIYNNVSMRSSKDLDILVKREQLEEAINLLESIGFQCSAAFKTAKRRECIFSKRVGHDFSLHDGDVEIELHWRMDAVIDLPFETLFEQKESSMLCGVNVYMPNSYANMYYLVMHGIKHCFVRLGWLMDIYELLQKEGYMDIQELYRYFSQKRTGYILLATLMLLDSAGIRPFQLEAEQEEFEAAKKLHDVIWPVIAAMDSNERRANHAEFTPVFWRELEERRVKEIVPWYEVLQPNFLDFEVVDLPDSLFFLYYPIRIIYWVWRMTPFYKGGYRSFSLKSILKRY